MLIVWAAQRRDEELGDHIVSRELSLDGAIVSESVELGRGYSPDVAADASAFVVAWRPADDSSLTFAAVSGSGSHPAPISVPVFGPPSSGALSLAITGPTIVAATCAADSDDVILVRDPFGAPAIDRFHARSGCNMVEVKSSGPGNIIALVGAKEFRGTEVVQVAKSATQTAFFLDGSCHTIANDRRGAHVCLDELDAVAAYIRTGAAEGKRIDAQFGGRVVEIRAAALDSGILLAWTVETSDGFALRAAVVQADGQALSQVVELGPQPVMPRFDLDGDGSTAWIVYVTERHVDESLYRHDVVVVPLRVTGT